MRSMIVVIVCLLTIGNASAEKQHFDTPLPARISCELTAIVYDWDFADGPNGFSTSACDDQGVPVWEYGATTYIPGAPGSVWGTVLEGDYPTDAGEGLLAPSFEVTEATRLMEIYHYYDAENLWDGGNVKVNGDVVTPISGYPGLISVPGDWYAWCVDFEFGFTGLDSGWVISCFDLSAYIGQTVQISFEFGSDDTFVEAGWYLASVKIGNDNVVDAQNSSWSVVKGLYR